LPWDLFVWLFVILPIRALWGTRLEWENPRDNVKASDDDPGGPCLTCEMKPGSWPVSKGRWPKGWYLRKYPDGSVVSWGGTTLGHAIFYGSEKRAAKGAIWKPVQVHEHVHVEQYEASMLRAFLVAIPVAAMGLYWLAFIIWITGYFQMGIANWATAWLRGEDPYRGSHHEEAAYAIDDDYEEMLKRLRKKG
jgi:hypothetical protein